MVQLFTHRIQEHHEENLMTARNLGVIFGRMLSLCCSVFVCFTLWLTRHRSYAYAFPQSCSRVQRHGWQGADHRMACRERANDFPANADVNLIIHPRSPLV